MGMNGGGASLKNLAGQSKEKERPYERKEN